MTIIPPSSTRTSCNSG